MTFLLRRQVAIFGMKIERSRITRFYRPIKKQAPNVQDPWFSTVSIKYKFFRNKHKLETTLEDKNLNPKRMLNFLTYSTTNNP